MVSDKVFKVTVIALLILILGAVFGTLSSLYVPEHEEFIDFDDDFVYLEGDHYSYEAYTIAEYEALVDQKFDTKENIFQYAQENNMEVEFEEDFIELIAEEECKEEKSGRFLCFEEYISFNLEEEMVEVTSIGFREHDEEYE